MSRQDEITRLSDMPPQLWELIEQNAVNNDRLMEYLKTVVYCARAAERKLRHEYRNVHGAVRDEKESWVEGEALKQALDDLDLVIADQVILDRVR